MPPAAKGERVAFFMGKGVLTLSLNAKRRLGAYSQWSPCAIGACALVGGTEQAVDARLDILTR